MQVKVAAHAHSDTVHWRLFEQSLQWSFAAQDDLQCGNATDIQLGKFTEYPERARVERMRALDEEDRGLLRGRLLQCNDTQHAEKFVSRAVLDDVTELAQHRFEEAGRIEAVAVDNRDRASVR